MNNDDDDNDNDKIVYKDYIHNIKFHKKKQLKLLHKTKREALLIWPELPETYSYENEEQREQEKRRRKYERHIYKYMYYTTIVNDLKKRQRLGEDINEWWDDLLTELDTKTILEERDWWNSIAGGYPVGYAEMDTVEDKGVVDEFAPIPFLC